MTVGSYRDLPRCRSNKCAQTHINRNREEEDEQLEDLLGHPTYWKLWLESVAGFSVSHRCASPLNFQSALNSFRKSRVISQEANRRRYNFCLITYKAPVRESHGSIHIIYTIRIKGLHHTGPRGSRVAVYVLHCSDKSQYCASVTDPDVLNTGGGTS